MKKRIVLLILGVAYIGLFALLLLSLMQISFLGGTPGKWKAALGTLVIGIPWLIVLRLYIYVKESSPPAEADQTRALGHEIFETIMSGYGLTGRESEIAWLLYRGYTNRQIGEELFIAETTVKKHVSHIYEKTQVSGRKEFRAKVNESPH
ncbi:MAG: helix-turn-helix transcriptional regulator [Lachnospiraceae bacterium]|nr:helix-turn-helix transcriptional regulator [Lachnospiraceae bacterium]